MDGYAVARALRGDPDLAATLLVALSGYALPDDVEKAAQAGFHRHLAKPVSLDELGAVLADGARGAESAHSRCARRRPPPGNFDARRRSTSTCRARAPHGSRRTGLLKRERVITTPQGAWIEADGRRVVNLCANNYLGLAGRPELVRAGAGGAAARTASASPRSASSAGRRTSTRSSRRGSRAFLGFEDAILFSSCFDANGGVFEALLGEEDAVVSDALNHASIIDGIRLCKAQRYRYANGDMADLEAQLREARRRRAPASSSS